MEDYFADDSEMRDLIIKSYEEVGGDFGFRESPYDVDPDYFKALPACTILTHIAVYSYLCILGGEVNGRSSKDMSHREVAINIFQEDVKTRLPRTLWEHVGKHYLNYVEEKLPLEGTKYNVGERLIECAMLMSLLEHNFDEAGWQLRQHLEKRSDETSEAIKGVMGEQDGLTKVILSITDEDGDTAGKMFNQLLSSDKNKKLHDLCTYLLQNYMIFCTDSRVAGLFFDADAGD